MTLAGATTYRLAPTRAQQPPDGLAPVLCGLNDLVPQFSFTPRRLAATIPFGKYGETVIGWKCKAPHDAAAHSKGVQIAVSAADRRLDVRQIPAGAFDDVDDVEGATGL